MTRPTFLQILGAARREERRRRREEDARRAALATYPGASREELKA